MKLLKLLMDQMLLSPMQDFVRTCHASKSSNNFLPRNLKKKNLNNVLETSSVICQAGSKYTW